MLASKELDGTWRVAALMPLLVYLLIAPLLPLLNVQDFWAESDIPLFDWQRFLSCLAIISSAIFCGLGLAVTRERCAVSVRTFSLFVYIFCSGAIAILISPDVQREAWREWLMYYLCALLCWTLIQTKSNVWSQFFDVMLLVVLGSSLCYLAWIIVMNHSGNWLEIPFESFQFPGFANIRMFSDWQSLVLPFFPLIIVYYCQSRFVRWAAYILASVIYALVFVSASRGIILAHALAHMALLLLLRRAYVRCFLSNLVLWGSGLLLYFLLKAYVLPLDQGFAMVASSGRSTSIAALTYTSDRQQLWMRAVELANQSPIFGIGPGRFALHPNPIAAAPHNAFLSVASEWGWPVAIVLCLTLVWSLWRRGQSFAHQYASVPWGLHKETDVRFMAYFLALVFFTQSMISTNVILGPVALICLIAVTVLLLPAAPTVHRASSIGVPWFLSGLALILPALIWGAIVLNDFHNTAQRNQHYRDCTQFGQQFAPRFWLQGWLSEVCANKPR
jgi:O-antigen ligase